MPLSKVSAFVASCSLICFALSATPADAQMSTEHQLGVLGTGDSQLDTGSYFDTYEIEGVEGQRVSISLDSSEFNAFLGLFDSEGNVIVTNDDAAQENPNSYISATLPRSGAYTVVATSQAAGEYGDYRLALRSFAPPSTVSTATSSSDSGAGMSGLMMLLSIPFVQDIMVDAFSSAFSTGGSSDPSYDHYYGTSTGSSSPSYGSSAPAVGGFYGNGPQHGTRNAW